MSRTIPLTRGYATIVDDEDHEEFSKHSWFVLKGGGRIYARRNILVSKGKRKTIVLHREIMRIPRGVSHLELQVDHISGDTLDNRKANLRKVTPAQNRMNAKLRKDNKSGYKGVYCEEKSQTWRAYIRVDGRLITLGFTKTKEEARELRKQAEIEYQGQYSREFGAEVLAAWSEKEQKDEK